MGVDGKRLAEPPLCYEVGVGGRAGGGLMAEYRKSVSACAAADAMASLEIALLSHFFAYLPVRGKWVAVA